MFASRADLLARSNSRRLANLAVPADVGMIPDGVLRIAIEGGDLTGYSAEVQQAAAMGLAAVDAALEDANSLIISYGIPATVSTPILIRMASTLALYFLQDAEKMTEEARRAYEAVVKSLDAHARGEINLIPLAPTDPVPTPDTPIIDAVVPRYRRSPAITGDW